MDNIEDRIREAKEKAKERNFTQSVDLIINLKNIELDNPENRFSEQLSMPYQVSEDTKVAVIGDTLKAENADRVISESELEELFEDSSEAKKVANEIDHFIAEAPLMPDIGRELGPVLGPRDKMPKPMPPGSDATERIKNLRQTVGVKVKEQPSVKIKIGTEAMPVENVADNAERIINFVKEQLPMGQHNIKNIYCKLTMGPVVELM